MQRGARLTAAIEVLGAVIERHQPVATAMTEWAKAHRFAGSGDRSAIATHVYDALRFKASSEFMLGSASPRALVLGGLTSAGVDSAAISESFTGAGYDPAPLSDSEQRAVADGVPANAPRWVRGNFPEWLDVPFARAFGLSAVDEGRALSARAPVDLRINSLKADREKVLKALARFNAEPTPYSPLGIRIAAPAAGAKQPHIEAETSHGKGWFEIQDEGSQIAAALSGAGPRMQVLDLCAGAGGKTLALAAQMQNTGQIYAYDSDRHQLRPIIERLKRAGARNVQVLVAGDTGALDLLGARFDVVLVDAPCTGSGTWRRRPDAKWRLKPEALAARCAEQAALLAAGAKSVKPGGRLHYVTCSVLPEENDDQVGIFLKDHPDFSTVPLAETWRSTLGGDVPTDAITQHGLLLTPARHGTDGFFISALKRT